MHCSDESLPCSRNFLKTPSLQEFDQKARSAAQSTITNEDGTTQNFCYVPKCSECGANMKPHCMFFDESYTEHYYRYETVKQFVESVDQPPDCLLVIGTALETSLAARIVNCHLRNEDVPVIEINMESSIKRGNNIQVLGKSEETLPVLFNEYYRL